jgi:hypothetical protein
MNIGISVFNSDTESGGMLPAKKSASKRMRREKRRADPDPAVEA